MKMWVVDMNMKVMQQLRKRLDDYFRAWLDRVGARCNCEVLFLRKSEREGALPSGVRSSSKYPELSGRVDTNRRGRPTVIGDVGKALLTLPDTGESGETYEVEMG